MRVELTEKSIDIVTTRSGLLVGTIDAICIALLLTISNLKVSAIVIALVIALTLPIWWLQQRRPVAAPKRQRPAPPMPLTSA
jgi:hypothetical protein